MDSDSFSNSIAFFTNSFFWWIISFAQLLVQLKWFQIRQTLQRKIRMTSIFHDLCFFINKLQLLYQFMGHYYLAIFRLRSISISIGLKFSLLDPNQNFRPIYPAYISEKHLVRVSLICYIYWSFFLESFKYHTLSL